MIRPFVTTIRLGVKLTSIDISKVLNDTDAASS
jgi:hypothetical protein